MRKGPHFTEAARAAAAAKRRERAGLAALTFNLPVVFVVRAESAGMRFLWDIRKFGGISLRRSTETFSTSAEARQTGLRMLERMLDGKTSESADVVELAEV